MQKIYYITCIGGTNNWEKTTAKTLKGAKALASKTWQVTHNSKLKVGVSYGAGDWEVEELAIKHGYSKWVNQF